MSRTRLLKPGFFKNDQLSECSMGARILFAGLWCMADREGKLKERCKLIKADIFPHDEVNVDNFLEELAREKLIIRYEASGLKLIYIPTFLEHQRPHPSEPKSVLPNFSNEINIVTNTHEEENKPHEKKCDFVPSPFNPSPFNPSLEFESNHSEASGPDDRKQKTNPKLVDPQIELDFDNLWIAWKPFDIAKGNKHEANKSYIKSRKETNHENIIRNAERYLRYCHAKQQRSQHLVTWLNQLGWKDEYPDISTTPEPVNGKRTYADSLKTATDAANNFHRHQENLRIEDVF